MDYNLTIVAYDNISGSVISDPTLVVSYMDGSTEVFIQPTSPGVYPCPDNTQIGIVASKTGYSTKYDGVTISGADVTKSIYMPPTGVAHTFTLYRADGNRRNQFTAHNFVAKLWHYVDGNWVEIESFSSDATTQGYFRSVLTDGDRYKITFSHSDNYFQIADCVWTASSSYNGYPEQYGAYYTWETTKTLFNVALIDAYSGAVITPDTLTLSYKVVYAASYATVAYNSYVGGYLIGHNGISTIYYKINATATGYDTLEYEDTWVGSTEVQSAELSARMQPVAQYTDMSVAVTDSNTGETISDATIEVYNLSTGEQIQPTSPGVYPVVYNRLYDYSVQATKTGYTGNNTTVTPIDSTPLSVSLALAPVIAYTIDVVEEATGDPIDSYIATVYKDDAWIETSTNGNFYIPWDGTSTYEIVVTATGYQTYTYTGTTYPTDPLEMIEAYTKLYITATDNVTGSALTPDTITVRKHDTQEVVPATSGYYEVELNSQYDYVLQKSGYYDYAGTITPTVRGSQTVSVVMTLVPLYTNLTIDITDSRHGTVISDATIEVTNRNTGDVITPASGVYALVYNYGYTYDIDITKSGYTPVADSVTPSTGAAIVKDYSLVKTLQYAKLYVTARDASGELDDVDITVTDLFTGTEVTKTDDYYPVIYNDNEPYKIDITKTGYYPYESGTITPDSPDDIDYVADMVKIPVYADLTVNVLDSEGLLPVQGATVVVTDDVTGQTIRKTGDVYKLLAEEDHTYTINVSAAKYYSSTITDVRADTTDPITEDVILVKIPVYVPVTIIAIDAETSDPVTGTIVVYDTTQDMPVAKGDDGKWHVLLHDSITITIIADGYETYTENLTVDSEDPITVTAAMRIAVGPYATADDYMLLTGKTLTQEEIERVNALLVTVSNLIRYEGSRVGIDVDRAILEDPAYKDIVKTVTVDVVCRVMRQSDSGEPMSQESQSALGYSWSGTYAIPGGGIAMSLMNNERKVLGFKRQTLWGIQLWHPKSKE